MIDIFIAPWRSARRGFSLVGLGIAPLLLAGCAHVPKDFGVAEVQAQARERSSGELAWPAADDASVIAALLDAPLTPESAVRIAFLRNPEIAIIFAELGLSRADLVEAETLPNPSLTAMVRFGVG